MDKPTLRVYTSRDLDKISARYPIKQRAIEDSRIVGKVFEFKTNNFVLDYLIDWDNQEDDPLFHLTFFNRAMLPEADFEVLSHPSLDSNDESQIVREIRMRLNPHPSDQSANVPRMGDQVVEGVQHKYKETVLLFPKTGQTCFAHCTFCFRWPQFIRDDEMQFKTPPNASYLDYLASNTEISDVLVTGGDPLIMRASDLEKYVLPLLEDRFSHVKNIRVGTKVLGFWPFRVLSDRDSDRLLQLFSKVVDSGKSLAFMAHFNHPREMLNDPVQKAIRRILTTGAVIRTQSPLLRTINDDADLWVQMWNEQVRLGLIPYYMFIERNTGPYHYFEMSLARAYDIYNSAISRVTGLARTARGPVMSASPGKVCVEGVMSLERERYFVLKYLQARDASLCHKPFLARYNQDATWFDQLECMRSAVF